MKIQKDSESFARATQKACRLLPEMFRPRIAFRFDSAFMSRSVVGSKGFVYTVKIWNEQISSFESHCDCAAGKAEFVCYHVASVWLDYQTMKTHQKVWNLSLLPQIVESSYVH